MQRLSLKPHFVLTFILALTLCIHLGNAETSAPLLVGENDSSPKIPPITYPKSTRLCRDLQKQQLAWAKKVMLEPFKAHLPADQPWSQDALAFVEEAIAEWAVDPAMENNNVIDIGQTTEEDQPVLLAKRGFQLVMRGCRDPLVLFLTNHLRRKTNGDASLANTVVQTFTELDASKDYPRALAWLAGLHADLVLEKQNDRKRLAEVDKRLPVLASESFQAGDYAGKDDVLFLFHALFFKPYFTREFEAISSICQTPSLPEWVRRTLLGYVEIQRAEKDPGGDEKHLKSARAELSRAWKLRPDQPWAAAEMIRVTMEGCGTPGDTERLWFDRAIAARFDFMPAYYNLFWSSRYHAGDSHAEMLALGFACEATKRYDTRVPRLLIKAVTDIADDGDDWRKLYHDPKIAARIVALNKGMLDNPARTFEWKRRAGYLAVESYLCGDLATASETFQKLNNSLPAELEKILNQHGFELSTVLKDIEAFNSPQGKSYQAAEKLLAEKKDGQAVAAYEALVKESPSGAVADIARTRLDMLKTEKLLASGDWVKLPEVKWATKGGEWTSTPEGTLAPQETTSKTIAIAPPRVEGAFELRADVEVTPPDYQEYITFYVVMGFRSHGENFGNCGFLFKTGNKNVSAYSCCNYFMDNKNTQVRLEKQNHYWVQVWNGQVTFFLNGVKVSQDYEPDWLKGDMSQCKMGFAAADIPKGTAFVVRNIEVRLLKSKPPVPFQSDSH